MGLLVGVTIHEGSKAKDVTFSMGWLPRPGTGGWYTNTGNQYIGLTGSGPLVAVNGLTRLEEMDGRAVETVMDLYNFPLNLAQASGKNAKKKGRGKIYRGRISLKNRDCEWRIVT